MSKELLQIKPASTLQRRKEIELFKNSFYGGGKLNPFVATSVKKSIISPGVGWLTTPFTQGGNILNSFLRGDNCMTGQLEFDILL